MVGSTLTGTALRPGIGSFSYRHVLRLIGRAAQNNGGQVGCVEDPNECQDPDEQGWRGWLQPGQFFTSWWCVHADTRMSQPRGKVHCLVTP